MPRPPIKSAQTQPDPKDSPADEPQDQTAAFADDSGTADEMRMDSIRAVRPAGSPQLWPYQQLPRRMRAQFFDYLRSLGNLETLSGLIGSGRTSTNMGVMADFMLVVADAEDAIRVVAHPSTADRLDAWLDDAPDEDVLSLLMWYIETFQPGEAKAS